MHNIFLWAILGINYTRQKSLVLLRMLWCNFLEFCINTILNTSPINKWPHDVNHSKYSLWRLVTCVSNFYSIEIFSGNFYLSAQVLIHQLWLHWLTIFQTIFLFEIKLPFKFHSFENNLTISYSLKSIHCH